MTFREITSDDVPALFDVRIATWHNEHGLADLTRMGITDASVRERIKDSHRGWLCEVDGRVVGFAMGDRTNGEMWVIAVLPQYEGRGIGMRLLANVEQWLCAQGWAEIWLTTHTDESFRAVGFYRSQGWQDWKLEGGNRYMRKRLASDRDANQISGKSGLQPVAAADPERELGTAGAIEPREGQHSVRLRANCP